MAALTQSAIDALLGVLTTAIQDEARLIGGVHSDMKFIKDEMDSMNGFLMHLNKLESERHDDQVRAWMKQVREVSYVAEDCVDRYVRVVDRYGVGWGGCVGTVAFSVAHPRAYLQLSKLGKQIAELKVRVHDVGERRQRYGVSVPEAAAGTIVDLSKMAQEQNDSKLLSEKREAFVHALAEEKDVVGTPAWFRDERDEERAPVLQDALVEQLPAGLLVTGATLPEAARTPLLVTMMHAILEKCCPPRPPGGAAGEDDAVLKDEATKTKAVDVDPDEAAAFRCTRKMFLCAMYVYPYRTIAELEKLRNKVVGVGVVAGRDDQETKKKVAADGSGVGAKEARKQVMTFCYSILTTNCWTRK